MPAMVAPKMLLDDASFLGIASSTRNELSVILKRSDAPALWANAKVERFRQHRNRGARRENENLEPARAPNRQSPTAARHAVRSTLRSSTYSSFPGRRFVLLDEPQGRERSSIADHSTMIRGTPRAL